jgi:glutamate-5-semialdehyde dehydrogenase
VHDSVASAFLPMLGAALKEKSVEIRGDARVLAALPGQVIPATEEDWATEYLDLILSIRSVPTMAAALDHIEKYGSRHSDVIITEEEQTAEAFLNSVDSAAVFWNASSRFNDGGEFGFGCEIGISTDKLHARGPMALPELTIYKYKVRGSGQVR